MTSRRARYRQHGNPFNVRGAIEVPDWDAIYGRAAPFAIDVGFGAGRFVIELARQHREWNVLGLEIRDHWVDNVRRSATELGLDNLHAMIANANTHLDELIPATSVAFVSINFPDPWFKKRHHKRRVVRRDWLDLLATKMLPDGELHYMTDYESAAAQTLELLRDHPDFVGAEGGFVAASSTGILTEREVSHGRREHPVFRIACKRVGAPATSGVV